MRIENNELMLPSGTTVASADAHFKDQYKNRTGKDPPTDTSSNIDPRNKAYGMWLLGLKLMGFIESREKRPEIPFEERQWEELKWATDWDTMTKNWIPMNMNKFPLFGVEVMSQTQIVAFEAWKEWAQNLQIKTDVIKIFDLSLTNLARTLAIMGKNIRMTQILPFIKTIIEFFPEFLPVRYGRRGGHTFLVDCNRPILLLAAYSKVINKGEFEMVGLAKYWSRMKSRRDNIQNLMALMRIISLVPIEVSDLLKGNAKLVMDEIYKLVSTTYVHDGISDNMAPVTHLYRDASVVGYHLFTATRQKVSGDIMEVDISEEQMDALAAISESDTNTIIYNEIADYRMACHQTSLDNINQGPSVCTPMIREKLTTVVQAEARQEDLHNAQEFEEETSAESGFNTDWNSTAGSHNDLLPPRP